MNKIEIKDFKKFLNERNVLLMFCTCYRQNRLTVNPPTLDEYLEKARVENVIPQAFVYPQKLYGKEFWLSINDEWIKQIQQSRAEKAFYPHAADQEPTIYRCGSDVQQD